MYLNLTRALAVNSPSNSLAETLTFLKWCLRGQATRRAPVWAALARLAP